MKLAKINPSVSLKLLETIDLIVKSYLILKIHLYYRILRDLIQ